MNMKIHTLLLVAVAIVSLQGCPKQTVAEKAQDNVDDALDRRPGEKIRDVVEDAND